MPADSHVPRSRLLPSVFAIAAFGCALARAGARPLPAHPSLFEEIAQPSGVNFVLNNSATPNKNQPESVIGGVALFDYDGDGYLDIYFVNGAALPSLEKQGPQYKNRLYHNNHDGKFTDVTDKAGVGRGWLRHRRGHSTVDR